MLPTGYFAPLAFEHTLYPPHYERRCYDTLDGRPPQAMKSAREGDHPEDPKPKKPKISRDIVEDDWDPDKSPYDAHVRKLWSIVREGATKPDNAYLSLHYFDPLFGEDEEILRRIRKYHPIGEKFDFKDHQREVLGRMAVLEKEPYKGLIVAEEMGLG